MTFRCPDCSAAGWMRITRAIELPPDNRSDEIMLQIVKCDRCRFEALAVYEESRRGALADESIDHRGYYVSKADLKAVKSRISKCPRPRDSRCLCQAHKQLGSKDEYGRWDGLAGIKLGRSFVLNFR
jgi:hypothetical protein